MASVPSGKKTEPIRVWLSEPLELALRRAADVDERSLSEFIELILRRWAWGNVKQMPEESEGPVRTGQDR